MGFVWDLQLCSAWDMGYEGDMGYGTNFPAYRDGISKNVWGIREYGFRGVWVRRESTVVQYSEITLSVPEKIQYNTVSPTE